MTRPTPAQRKVLEKMAAGWRLLSYEAGMGRSVRLVVMLASPTDEPAHVSVATYSTLHRNGWIEWTGGLKGKWRLTPAGRAVIEEPKEGKS